MNPSEPALRVVKGDPTPEELAALVTALAVLRPAPTAASDAPEQSGWSAYWRSVRAPIPPGPSAWRMSARG